MSSQKENSDLLQFFCFRHNIFGVWQFTLSDTNATYVSLCDAPFLWFWWAKVQLPFCLLCLSEGSKLIICHWRPESISTAIYNNIRSNVWYGHCYFPYVRTEKWFNTDIVFICKRWMLDGSYKVGGPAQQFQLTSFFLPSLQHFIIIMAHVMLKHQLTTNKRVLHYGCVTAYDWSHHQP